MAEEGEAATQRLPEHKEEETGVSNQQVEVEEEEKSSSSVMKPWEQHWGVISIPRFDYNAPSSLLQNSHSGFLITCTISQCFPRLQIFVFFRSSFFLLYPFWLPRFSGLALNIQKLNFC